MDISAVEDEEATEGVSAILSNENKYPKYPITKKIQKQDIDNNSNPEYIEYSSHYKQIYQLSVEVLSLYKGICFIENIMVRLNGVLSTRLSMVFTYR